MKQIRLLTIAILLIASTSHAQINKGATVLGGNINFSTQTSKTENDSKRTLTSFAISPSLMIIYNNNRAFGFNINYEYSKYSYFDKPANGYGAGVFLRQYKPLGKGFYVFAQEALNFNYRKSLGIVDSAILYNSKGYEAILAVNPGLAFDLNKRIQLELLFFNNLLAIDYTRYKYDQPNASDVKIDNFSIGANLDGSQLTSLNIGAKIFFGR
jgi:hypothetical protein